MKSHKYIFGPITTAAWFLLATLWAHDAGKDPIFTFVAAIVGMTAGVLVSFAIELLAIKLREHHQAKK
jgi:hypothetical protein